MDIMFNSESLTQEINSSLEGTSWKILIADDEPEVHMLTQMVLEEHHFDNRKFEFLSAFSGAETIETLENTPDIALILLDVVMEEENSGLKVVQHIRETMGNKNIRIILRTGQPGQAPAEKVILGYDINDYKEKTELTAQRLLTSVISSLRAYKHILNISELNAKLEEKVLERTKALKKAKEVLSFANSRMKNELEMAKKIQETFIPTSFPITNLLDFKGYYQAMEEVGGDFYDVFPISENKLALVIADVSGHGVPAAFITTIAKMSFINFSKPEFNTAQITEKVNKHIYLTIKDLGYYLTAFFAIIDTKQGIMEFTNAGHNGAFLIKAAKQIEALETQSTCIGVFLDYTFKGKQIKLSGGDKLVLYTDGITDTRNKKGEFLSVKLLKTILLDNGNLPAKEMIEKIMEKVSQFSDGASQDDDRTLLVIDVLSDTGEIKTNAASIKK